MQDVYGPPKDTKCPSWAYMVPCWGTGKKQRVLPRGGGAERLSLPTTQTFFIPVICPSTVKFSILNRR